MIVSNVFKTEFVIKLQYEWLFLVQIIGYHPAQCGIQFGIHDTSSPLFSFAFLYPHHIHVISNK